MKLWLVGGTGVLLLIVSAMLLGDFFLRPKERSNDLDRFEESSTGVAPQEPVMDKPITTAAPPAPVEEKAEVPSGAPSPTAELNAAEKTMQAAKPPKSSGAVDVLKRAYAQESSDASSREIEQQIRSLFGAEYLPIEMLRSITCRKTVCKISVYWTKDNPLSYMVLVMKVGYQQSDVFAIESASEPDREGRLPVDVYVIRSGHTLAEIQ
jgi:hypothetical protein